VKAAGMIMTMIIIIIIIIIRIIISTAITVVITAWIVMVRMILMTIKPIKSAQLKRV
jgi:hypothetical protein